VAHAFSIKLVKLVAPICVSVRILPLNTSILVSLIASKALRRALIIGTISSVNSDTACIVPSLTCVVSLRVASVSALPRIPKASFITSAESSSSTIAAIVI
jgi:hypothetical protein